MSYRRTVTFERDGETPLGVIRGTLATDGEASDGHILSIAGGEVAAGIPLLFGHDDFTGERNLGRWTEFTKTADRIRGEAVIELQGQPGSGTLEWRQDMAHMIHAGNVSGLSLRWEPTAEPVRRVNLASDHPAFVDAEAERNPMKRYGYFFPRWRALEGSVVTLGADKSAVIGRMHEAAEPLRPLWQHVARSLDDQARADELEAIVARACAAPPELIPAPRASQPTPTIVSATDYQAMLARVLEEVVIRPLAGMRDETRARIAKEFARALGK